MLLKIIAEMAGPAQTCSVCGTGPLHKTHTYGGKDTSGNTIWYCKKANLIAAGLPPVKTQAIVGLGTPGVSTKPAPGVVTPKAKRSASPEPHKPTTAASTNNANASIRDKTDAWLKRFKIQKYTIADDDTVVVYGNMYFEEMPWKQIPVKFSEVHGDISLSGEDLETLKNFPKVVDGSVFVNHNNLHNVEGCPTTINGSLVISANRNLTSLDGMDKIEIEDSFICNDCPNLKFSKIHKHIKSIGGTFKSNSMKSNALGLLLIRNLQKVELGGNNKEVAEIINKHLEGERDVHACQEELIDAGYGEYAKL